MKSFFFGASMILATAAASTVSAQGAGASVDWKLMPGDDPLTVFDAPPNFDKQYRVCFQSLPEVGKIEVALFERKIEIKTETCIDVISNRIRLEVTDTTEPLQGIFYLVE